MLEIDWKIIAALAFTLMLMALPVLHRKFYGRVPVLDAGKLLAMVNSGKNFRLIDLRPSKAFQTAHIHSAINIPCSRIQTCLPEILELRKHTASDIPLILVCESDLSSTRLCKSLINAGCENLFVLKGGFNYWKRKRLETVR